MITTITFDTENPDDSRRLKQMLAAETAWACLFDVVHHKIRNHYKHGTPLTLEDLREYIHEYCSDCGGLDAMINN